MKGRRLDRRQSRFVTRSIALLRQVTGRSHLSVTVAIYCPWCRLWESPRRFDLRHMACRTCVRTLARPTRIGRG
ncbi:hypothetical protein [Actinoplanes teichomyceticus]|uniref:hypothetical protein n=1 Tax=Actinoplanes teichomyceticus TaxID=1867 RepID=UPI000F0A5253|nr:hypothetical protein [Actinoplanes teichomyceticus]GIF15273.1 hypothetical protein Ate01nite_53050 [Actinoplanes teichomyceticus]